MRKLILTYILLIFVLSRSSAQKALPQEYKAAIPWNKNNNEADFLLYNISLEKPHSKQLKDHNYQIIRKLKDGWCIIKYDSIEPNNSHLKNHYELPIEWKLSKQLKHIYTEKRTFSTIRISVHYLNKVLPKSIENEKFSIINDKNIVLEVTKKELKKLMLDEQIIFIDLYKTPLTETPISSSDFSVNGIFNAIELYPQVKGENVHVSIKELLFDVNDIDYASRVLLNGNEATSLDQHATAMATLIAGASNSGPKGLGLAPKTQISSSSFLQLFPDESAQFIRDQIYVQNHSYGVNVENFYGNEASAYDEQLFNLQDIVHVFSVGNRGLETPENGPYAGLTGYATISGNFKQAKNIVVVGATDAMDVISERSSKGPSFDGRIKPDVVAYAPEGTSDAAALVSGTIILLQDHYLQKFGKAPLFSLIKSSIIAGSEDVGLKGIDFLSGYGKLQSKNSLDIIAKDQFFQGSLSANEEVSHLISVPTNTSLLKVALTWLDTNSSPGSTQLLNNDLNMTLSNPANMSVNPWVLNSFAHADSLNLLAKRGVDNLNTSEFISIENPQAGVHSIRVLADAQNTNTVPYAISYFLETSELFKWEFPLENQKLATGSNSVVRWKSTINSDVGSLAYRIDGGTWIDITNTISLSESLYSWVIPAINGTVELQMTSGIENFISPPFQVSRQITPAVSYNCMDEVAISWDPVPNAISYEIKSFIEGNLQFIGNVSDPFFINQKASNNSEYFAVAPIFQNASGIVSNTININDSGVQCYYKNFFAFLNEIDVVDITLELSTLLNISEIQIVKTINDEEILISSFGSSFENLTFSLTDTFLFPGTNNYFAKIILEDGTTIETDRTQIFIPENDALLLFPNPIENGLNLNFISRGFMFQIVDLNGKVILEDVVLGIEDFIDINLSQGIYIFRILDENKKDIVAKKFIVK